MTCTVKIAQVGISEVVYSQGYNMDESVRSYNDKVSRGDVSLTWVEFRVPLSLSLQVYAYDSSVR